MLRLFGQAAAAPFRHPVAAFRALVIVSAWPLLLGLGFSVANRLLMSGQIGRSGDPVLAQHLLWLAGAPETWALLLGPVFILTAPWALALWWRGMDGTKGWRVPSHVYGAVLLLLLLPLAVILGEAVVFALLMPMPEGVDVAMRMLAVICALGLLYRLAPRFAHIFRQEDRTEARPKPVGVPICALFAILTTVFQLALSIVLLLLSLLPGPLFSSLSNLPVWLRGGVHADLTAEAVFLATVYSGLVAIAAMRALSETDRVVREPNSDVG